LNADSKKRTSLGGKVRKFSSRTAFGDASNAKSHRSLRERKRIARKWCKAGKNVEEGEVSTWQRKDFHNLINTCVENLTDQKCSSVNSARGLLRRPQILTMTKWE